MAHESVVLNDLEKGVWVEHFAQEFGPFQVAKQMLCGGRQHGVDVIDIRSGRMRTRIVPTRGMGLAHVTLDTDSSPTQFSWNSPVDGPVYPSWVPIDEPSGLGWLDGFDELFVRCGLKNNGAPQFDDAGRLQYPLHGRIANLPAKKVQLNYDPESETLEVSGTIIESRFHFDKFQLDVSYRFNADSNSIQVEDKVTNFGGTPNDFQMLYHYNLGPQLLEPGGEIYIPSSDVVPRDLASAEKVSEWNHIQPPAAGASETAYFFCPKANSDGRSLALLTNAAKNLAAGIRFNPETLPCLTLWKNLVSERDGFVVGIEPGTNYPNTRSFEEQHDRVVSLQPGESHSFPFELVFADSNDEVRRLVDESTAMQADEPAEVSDMPRPDWCE